MLLKNFHWLATLLAGVALVGLSIYWFVRPLAMLNALCIQEPCGIGIIAAGFVLILGLTLVGAGIVTLVRSKQTQTVTISINDEAEADAEAIGELEEALERKQSPEKRLAGKVAGKQQKQVNEKEFLQLPKEELKLKKKR